MIYDKRHVCCSSRQLQGSNLKRYLVKHGLKTGFHRFVYKKTDCKTCTTTLKRAGLLAYISISLRSGPPLTSALSFSPRKEKKEKNAWSQVIFQLAVLVVKEKEKVLMDEQGLRFC